MKNEIGLWIDHKEAIIVTDHDAATVVRRVMSDVGKRVRYSGASEAPENGHNNASENGRDRYYREQLYRYYDEVISHIAHASAILILGPGEAKSDLRMRLEAREKNDCTVVLKTIDKLTEAQIVAEVRQQFSEITHVTPYLAQQKPLAQKNKRVGAVTGQFPLRKRVWAPYQSGSIKKNAP